jgi:Holliday junction resolvase
MNKKDLPLEKEVQKRIIKRYEEEGYIVVKITLCSKPGFPDLLLLKNGIAKFIEVKRPGGKPRPLQAYRIDELRNAGFEVEVLDH